MPMTINNTSTQSDQISKLMGQRASNLFLTRQLWCSGSVLLTLNQGFSGDLSQDQVIRLASGLGDGLGGSGCLCGGLNGAALALGLFLGQGRLASACNQLVLEATQQLYAQFKSAYGTTCCRVLSKGVKHGSQKHFQRGAKHTAKAAELAAELILQHKPEIIQLVNWRFLNKKENLWCTCMKKVANFVARQ